MTLRDVMTTNVLDLKPSDSIQTAATQMRKLDIGAIPVCENDKLIGMVTDRDITVRGTASGKSPQDCCVRDVMSSGLVYCYDDEDVSKAAQLMEEKQIRRLPVLDRSHHLVGIVSLGDLATRQHNEHLAAEALQQVSQPKQHHV